MRKISIVLFLSTAISEFIICRLQDANGLPLVTSVYDWEMACIVPAILSDPLMAVEVDLVTDENAAPSFIRVSDDATPTDLKNYTIWAKQYFTVRTYSILFCL